MSRLRAIRRAIKRGHETRGQGLGRLGAAVVACFVCRRTTRVDRARGRHRNICPQCDAALPGVRS